MDLEEENRILWAQVEYFSSDDHVRRKVEPWRDRTPEERLIAALGQFDWALRCLERLPPEVRRRAETPPALPEDLVEILERMRRGAG